MYKLSNLKHDRLWFWVYWIVSLTVPFIIFYFAYGAGSV